LHGAHQLRIVQLRFEHTGFGHSCNVITRIGSSVTGNCGNLERGQIRVARPGSDENTLSL
jgi:hypothetical protein